MSTRPQPETRYLSTIHTRVFIKYLLHELFHREKETGYFIILSVYAGTLSKNSSSTVNDIDNFRVFIILRAPSKRFIFNISFNYHIRWIG